MKVTKHGEFLQQLTRFTLINCYLVREEDGFTLIDMGISGTAKNITALVQELKLPITRISLTHAHGDHAGSLDAICEQWPQAELALGARSVDFLTGTQTLKADEPQARLKGQFVQAKAKATRVLKPGDTLGSLEVVASPGHTPDHIAFIDRRDGTLIAGDAFQTKGGIAVAGTVRWLFPFPALATWHKPTALESAKRLHGLNPSRLAVGHGVVLEQSKGKMGQAIGAAA